MVMCLNLYTKAIKFSTSKMTNDKGIAKYSDFRLGVTCKQSTNQHARKKVRMADNFVINVTSVAS